MVKIAKLTSQQPCHNLYSNIIFSRIVKLQVKVIFIDRIKFPEGTYNIIIDHTAYSNLSPKL